MPKVIKSGVREVVLRVKDIFMKEKQSSAPIIPFERVNERVAAATGISLRTVARIGNEGRLAEASSIFGSADSCSRSINMSDKRPESDLQVILRFLRMFDPPAVRRRRRSGDIPKPLADRSFYENTQRNRSNRAGAATRSNREVFGVERFSARSTETARNPSTAGRNPEQTEHGTTSLSRTAAVVLSNPPHATRPAPGSANGHPTP